MMNLKKPAQSTTIFVKNLNANDRFVLPGQHTVYVCESRHNGESGTLVTYRLPGETGAHEFFTRQMSTVYLIED